MGKGASSVKLKIKKIPTPSNMLKNEKIKRYGIPQALNKPNKDQSNL